MTRDHQYFEHLLSQIDDGVLNTSSECWNAVVVLAYKLNRTEELIEALCK